MLGNVKAIGDKTPVQCSQAYEATVADILLEGGHRVLTFVKRGGTVSQFATHERVEAHKCFFALAWVNAIREHPDLFLQAVMENWSYDQIARAIAH